MTHQRPQTGDLVACWAFVLHYYQPVIRQAHGQLWISSEGSSLPPLQSPSPCCYHYSDRLRLSWCYWNATGGTSCFTCAWKKKPWEWQKGRGIVLKEKAGCFASHRNSMFGVGKKHLLCDTAGTKTSIWSVRGFILIQVYLPFSIFSVNCERGFSLSADKHAR